MVSKDESLGRHCSMSSFCVLFLETKEENFSFNHTTNLLLFRWFIDFWLERGTEKSVWLDKTPYAQNCLVSIESISAAPIFSISDEMLSNPAMCRKRLSLIFFPSPIYWSELLEIQIKRDAEQHTHNKLNLEYHQFGPFQPLKSKVFFMLHPHSLPEIKI